MPKHHCAPTCDIASFTKYAPLLLLKLPVNTVACKKIHPLGIFHVFLLHNLELKWFFESLQHAYNFKDVLLFLLWSKQQIGQNNRKLLHACLFTPPPKISTLWSHLLPQLQLQVALDKFLWACRILSMGFLPIPQGKTSPAPLCRMVFACEL